MAQAIKFGTDGWRAQIADKYTFANVRRCAQGFASYLIEQGNQGQWIVVGHDKRFLGENFAKTVAEVFAGNGFKVYLTDGSCPTPVISYAVVAQNAIGAVNITASHNPSTDNGFKVRDENGGAIAPDGLKKIESLIPVSVNDIKSILYSDAKATGKIVKFDPNPKYISHIKELVDLDVIKNAGLKILVDPMWGNGIGWLSDLLAGGKTEVVEIHNMRNPIFPEMSRPEPIPPNVDVGLKAVIDHEADVLIIFDGDADRLGIGDECGRFVNQLQVYGLLAYYLLEVRGERGAIVKTLSTTKMLNKLGKIYDVPIHETGVGFKYVAPKFLETDALIGGGRERGLCFSWACP